MNFTESSDILNAFDGGAFESIEDDYVDICLAQDQLIAQLTSKGAVIKGWKLVEDNGVFILSPIFDFQLFQNHDARLPQSELSGIEVEICYQCLVPTSDQEAEVAVNQSQPLVAIEALRPKINLNNYNACDFYFNYGILVSSLPVSGVFLLENGQQKQAYNDSTGASDFFEQKKSILAKGVRECIRRGYVESEYFFMTGSLNGLIATDACLGKNDVIHQDDTLISFEIVS